MSRTRSGATARISIPAWNRQVKGADWATPADVKRAIGSASILNDGRAVFNIAGNKYRVVVLTLAKARGLLACRRLDS
jgi:mRNA interferase HigB